MTEKDAARGRRKEPRQERSKKLVAFIIEAGVRLLEEEGPDALTTTRVAEVAGVSVGSIYQYFKDRDGIADAIYRHKLAQEWNQLLQWGELADLPPIPMIHRIIDTAVERHRRFLELHAEFYRDRVAEFSLDNFSTEKEHQSVTWLCQLFERHRSELAIENPEHAAYIVSRGISSILRSTIQDRPEYVFDDAFIEELKVFVTAFLESKAVKGAAEP